MSENWMRSRNMTEFASCWKQNGNPLNFFLHFWILSF